jgi:hypothetical protein
MFDHLTATVKHLHTYLAPDNKDMAEWLNELKEKTKFFTDHYAPEAIAEALDQWKEHQIRERAKDLEQCIRGAVAESSKAMLMDAAAQMGLTLKEDPLRTLRRNPPRVAR